MDITRHANIRIQQRGVPPLILEWLLDFGACEVKHGARRRFFDKRSRRQLAQRFGSQIVDRLGDLLNCYLVEDDGRLVTAGHRTKRVRRN
jgi:hypothetical protein